MDLKEYFSDIFEDKNIRIYNKAIEKSECCFYTYSIMQESFISRLSEKPTFRIFQLCCLNLTGCSIVILF